MTVLSRCCDCAVTEASCKARARAGVDGAQQEQDLGRGRRRRGWRERQRERERAVGLRGEKGREERERTGSALFTPEIEIFNPHPIPAAALLGEEWESAAEVWRMIAMSTRERAV